MTQKFLTVTRILSVDLKKPHIIKTYSFTTEDDDMELVSPVPAISNHDKLLSINSPSIDSYNNDEDSSENSKKLRKRKSRRHTELENHTGKKIPVNRKRPWYKKINFSKLLTVIFVIIVVYLMWTKRDVWIQRLLTSNIRIRRFDIIKDDEGGNSTMNSSPQEDIIEDTEEKNDLTPSTNTQKINIRTRRNKMNFNTEIPKKKHYRRSQNSSIDDQEEEEEEDKPVLPSSTKKKHQHRSLISKQNSSIHIPTTDDIFEQLQKNLKSRRHQREFFSKLSKATGLRKDKLYRSIYKNDYKKITLQTFVSLLDSFNLMLLIVPK